MSNFDLKVIWALDVNTATREKALFSHAAAAGRSSNAEGLRCRSDAQHVDVRQRAPGAKVAAVARRHGVAEPVVFLAPASTGRRQPAQLTMSNDFPCENSRTASNARRRPFRASSTARKRRLIALGLLTTSRRPRDRS
jgi:hypothetical protein